MDHHVNAPLQAKPQNPGLCVHHSPAMTEGDFTETERTCFWGRTESRLIRTIVIILPSEPSHRIQASVCLLIAMTEGDFTEETCLWRQN